MKTGMWLFGLLLVSVLGTGCGTRQFSSSENTISNTPLTKTVSEKTLNVAKVKVMKSGKIFLDGTEVALAELKVEFARLSSDNGEVWYYRENAQEEPSPEAMMVIKAIADNNLPVKLSSRPDFSDSVDFKGVSRN